MSRHSCKQCKYHLCTACHAAATQEWLQAEISVTIYRAARPGVEEDTWQVCVERGTNIRSLKNKVAVLYGVAPEMQTVRRDVDSQPLADDEQLACDEGDVLHLSVVSPLNNLMSSLGMALPPPLEGLAEAITGAMNEVTQVNQAMQQSLEAAVYNLTFVLPGKAPAKEKRCRLEISAVARVQEVLETVKLELDVEDLATGLEYAGQELPMHVPIHALGLRDGDVVMVIRCVETTSL
jgi:hypothetical protein